MLSDTELLERLAILYDATRVEEVGAELARLRAEGNEAGAERLRTRFTHRMYDLSEFVKALKQIFTQWYNRRAKRRGTLWEDRFKSVLIEPSRAREGQWNNALLTMAAYIDWPINQKPPASSRPATGDLDHRPVTGDADL